MHSCSGTALTVVVFRILVNGVKLGQVLLGGESDSMVAKLKDCVMLQCKKQSFETSYV